MKTYNSQDVAGSMLVKFVAYARSLTVLNGDRLSAAQRRHILRLRTAKVINGGLNNEKVNDGVRNNVLDLGNYRASRVFCSVRSRVSRADRKR